MNRKRRRAVRSRKQIGVDTQRDPRAELVRRQILVDAMRPDDLLGGGHPPGQLRRSPVERGTPADRAGELAPADGEDAAAPADLLFLRRQRHRRVGLVLRDVAQLSRIGIETEGVAVAGVGHGLGTLHHVQPEIERIAAEDVPHVRAADDHHLEAGFFRDPLQSGRAHLARGTDREAVAGDDEGLATVHAGAKAGHQIAEGPRFPALVQRVEALRHAVGRGRNLIGINRVELPREARAGKTHRIPEDERLPGDQAAAARRRPLARGLRQRVRVDARLQPGGLYRVHPLEC